MKAEIIAVGSELINGEKLNSNVLWLSARICRLGFPARFHTTLGDDLAENVDAFRVALQRANLVIVTGGIGPTQDDLSREVLVWRRVR
jgi:nicotinamide-nucleotide amidase